MELHRQLRLLRRQQELALERVPNNNGQRLITATQLAARSMPLPPFFLPAARKCQPRGGVPQRRT
jgi:hypothetical protein